MGHVTGVVIVAPKGPFGGVGHGAPCTVGGAAHKMIVIWLTDCARSPNRTPVEKPRDDLRGRKIIDAVINP